MINSLCSNDNFNAILKLEMVISRQMAKQKSNTGAFRSTLRQKLRSAASFDGLSIHLSTLKCSPLELKRGVRKEERGRGEQRSKERD